MTRFHMGGRGQRPGLLACNSGSVTVEAAGALMALTIFFSMLVSGLGAFGGQLALTALARDAARAAALQPDRAAAEAAVRRVVGAAGDVDVRLLARGGFVGVTLSRDFRVLRLPTPLHLRAGATAYQESPW